MVKTNPNKIKQSFSRTFVRKKIKQNKYFKSTQPLTDEEIERIRKEMNIVPHDKIPFDPNPYKRPL